jgi:hypothetical protein
MMPKALGEPRPEVIPLFLAKRVPRENNQIKENERS